MELKKPAACPRDELTARLPRCIPYDPPPEFTGAVELPSSAKTVWFLVGNGGMDIGN